MSLPPAYWDSSALVPLCVSQPQTANARSFYAKYRVMAWWATEVEIISGLARLERMKQISHDRFLVGQQLAMSIVHSWTSVNPPPSIASKACLLIQTHSLRAADALQLATALDVCDDKPQGYVFITADQRLADAARQTGFAVEFI